MRRTGPFFPHPLVVLVLAITGVSLPALSNSLMFVPLQVSQSSPSSFPQPQHQTSSVSQGTVGQANLFATVDVKTLASAGSSQSSMIPYVASSSMSSPQALGTSAPSQSLANFTTSNVGILTSFQGLNKTLGGGFSPPDVILATGPSHVFEMVNLAGEIFTKQGSSIQTFPLSSFFLTGTDQLSDPKVLYDSSSGRWFASIIDLRPEFVNSARSLANVTLAVSTSSDPTSTWEIYGLRLGENLPDQPIIGINDDKFVVSTNDFSPLPTPTSPVGFLGAQYWVLNKNEMVNGAATVDFVSFGPNGSLESVHPVQSLSPKSTLYMVTVGAGELGSSSSNVQLFSINGIPPGIVTVNQVTLGVSTISQPPVAVQPDPSHQINTDDYRVLDAKWFQGRLWYSLTDGCVPKGDTTTRSCVRLTEINTASSSIVQDFDFGVAGQYYFYPAIAIDSSGNLEAVYGYSSSSIYPSLAVTGRLDTDPPATIAPTQTLVAGTSNDESAPCSGVVFICRYGDYFGAATDPSDATQVWVGGEYHPLSPGWSTFIGSITMTTSFTLSDNPAYLNIAANSSSNSTITLKSIAGFSGTVTLSTSVSPSGGPTVTVSPSAITLSSGGTTTVNGKVSASATTTSGPYTITVTATGGGTTKQTVLIVTVGPDFSLTVSPASLAGQAGSTIQFTLKLASLNGFAGTVTLSPDRPPVSQISISPINVTLSPGGTGTSTLTLTLFSQPVYGVPPQDSPGLFGETVTGTSGSLKHSIGMIVTVTGFSLSTGPTGPCCLTPRPAAFSIPAGSSGTTKVLVTSSNGFGGNVRLTASISPSGPTVTLSPSTVTLPSGGVVTATVTMSTSSSAPAGVYTVTITGANNSASASVPIDAIVTPLTVNIDPYVDVIGPFNGVIYTTSGSLSVDSPTAAPTLSGKASIVGTNSTTGAVVFSMNYTITGVPINSCSKGCSTYYSDFPLNIPANPYPLASEIYITFQGLSTSFSGFGIRNPDINGDGVVNIVDFNIVLADNNCSLGMACYNPRADVDMDGVIDGTDLSIVDGAIGFPNIMPNFNISASSTQLTMQGSPASTTLTLRSTNTFAGTVNLAVYVSPGTVTATLSSTSVVLKSGGSGSSTLTVSSTSYGIFTVNITGTNGVLSHSVMIMVYAGDFVMNSGVDFINIFPGGSYPTSIAVDPFNGLAGSVSLSVSVSPPGLTATLNPTSGTMVPFGPRVTSSLKVASSTVGSYTVTVAATLGSLAHSVVVVVIVGNPCHGCQRPATLQSPTMSAGLGIKPTIFGDGMGTAASKPVGVDRMLSMAASLTEKDPK